MGDIYRDGTYLENYPLWHSEDSAWKAAQIIEMIERNSLNPATVCEVGCGAGEILNRLSDNYPEKEFHGYEISPQAFEICSAKSNTNLSFHLRDMDDGTKFDLVLAIDIIEHIEDYFGFLKKLKQKGAYKMFHIPLDLSVQTVLRSTPILKGRRRAGHIHYFTKETALETLKDAGYEIVDHFYTAVSLGPPTKSWKTKLLRVPRKIAFSISKDLTVRIMGGFSLLVLAR